MIGHTSTWIGTILCSGAAWFFAERCWAQNLPEPKPGDAMIEKYLAQETAKVSQRFLDGAGTREEWEKRRPRMRQEYLDMLGLWPLPEKTPLRVRFTGSLERAGVVIDKLHYQSRPGLYATGNLYRPQTSGGRKPPDSKLPAVLYVCGHSGRGRDGNKTAFQDHGMWFASNGYICLIIDTLQLGEIPGIHHGTYREGRWWWQAQGYTPAGVECWNGIRAIDYLVSRSDVDPERIAVTGISGGGAATIWIAAADERVRCAVPVSGMSDLESYVTNKVINAHCDCMFLVNTYGWEWTTIAALIAPRPLLFANSDNDKIFPMDGNRRIIERLRKIYQMYGDPERVDDYVSKGGHDYRSDSRIAVFKWINRHLKNETGPVKDADFKPIAGMELRVFPQDNDIPGDAINGKIDETFLLQPTVKLPEEGKFEEWKKNLMKQLREKSFRPLPERISPGTVLKIEKSFRYIQTEPGIFIFAADGSGKKTSQVRTLVVLGKDKLSELIEQVEQDSFWYKTDLRGGVEKLLAWTAKSPPNYVERSHALLGRTVDQGRVWDIIACIRYFDEMDKGKYRWRIAGRGPAFSAPTPPYLSRPSKK